MENEHDIQLTCDSGACTEAVKLLEAGVLLLAGISELQESRKGLAVPP